MDLNAEWKALTVGQLVQRLQEGLKDGTLTEDQLVVIDCGDDTGGRVSGRWEVHPDEIWIQSAF